MKNITLNVNALSDAISLVAGTVGGQLINATYAVIDAAEKRGFEAGKEFSATTAAQHTADAIA
jgi:hypothetical protein